MYIGNSPTYGDTTSNFKLLDDISTYTLTFDGSSSAVVSTSNYTITQTSHRFITGQRVTYTNGGGGSIGGLTSGTAYYIIKNDQNTVKLALTQSDAINSIAINLTALGTGSTHTLNVAFDGVNTKFKATYDNGTKALFTAAAQLQISINGVIQQPQNTTTPVNGFGFDLDAVVIFSTAPLVSDVFWGNIIANNFAAYDISDNKVDNFTGTGSQTAFYLSQEVPNNESLLVTIDGVVQYPSDVTTSRAYSVYNTQLIFTSAPGNGTIIQARHIGFAGAVTSNVTGFYGRTGNAVLTTADTISIGAATIGTGGIGTSLLVQGNARITGILTIGTGSITLDGTNNIISGIDQTNTNNTTVLGIATFTNGPVIIGTSSSTGTASQRLQVTGGAYVSGSVGIGTTNPQYETHLYGNKNGDVSFVIANKTNGTSARSYFSVENDLGGNGAITFTSSSYTGSGDWRRPSALALYTSGANSSGGIAIAARNTSGYIDFYTGGNNQRAIIDSTGNLLINNTSATGTASQPLQVTGSAYISGGLGVGVNNNTTAGSISVSGQITSTQANSTTTGGGQIYLNGATGNRIDFNTNGVAAPTFSTRSAGTKIVLYPLVGAAAVDCAIGIDNDTFWSSVDTSSSRFRWYAGTTNIATLSGTGGLTIADTITLTTKPFFRNVPTIAADYTVTTTYNELSIGPITINNGITVTVNSGATWTVV